MLSALAAIFITVQPGDTLSGIAVSHGVSLAAVEAANPQIENFNLIYAGNRVAIPKGGSYQAQPQPTYRQPSQAPSNSYGVAGTGGGSLSDVPGVPSSFAACVALRESGDGSGSSNIYGIIPGSGYSVAGDSLAQQKAVFAQIYQRYGVTAWQPWDGC